MYTDVRMWQIDSLQIIVHVWCYMWSFVACVALEISSFRLRLKNFSDMLYHWKASEDLYDELGFKLSLAHYIACLSNML